MPLSLMLSTACIMYKVVSYVCTGSSGSLLALIVQKIKKLRKTESHEVYQGAKLNESKCGLSEPKSLA